jgi:hypothetical protein
MRFSTDVITGLKRQVEVRHEPALGRERLNQIVVCFDRVDRGEAQPRKLRDGPKDCLHKRPEPRRAFEIRP